MYRISPFRAARSSLTAIMALSLCGCALSPRNAVLTYPPTSDGSLVAVASAAPMAPPRARTMLVLPFRDARPDTKKVGRIRDLLGIPVAPIRTTGSVPAWVADALTHELRRAGFDVVEAQHANDSSLVIGGEVRRAHADAYLSVGAAVEIAVRVTQGGRELHSATYTGHGSGGVNWTGTSKSFADALSRALADALRNVVDDVITVADGGQPQQQAPVNPTAGSP